MIAAVAITSGILYLKKWREERRADVCEMIPDRKKAWIIRKMEGLVKGKNLGMALGGVIALGFLVNLFELFCSLGLPVIYTGVLTSLKLPDWQYYLYLILYTAIYLVDDIIIFGAAIVTLKAAGTTVNKYAKWIYLGGGIVMIGIGIWLLGWR